ncbi:Complement C3 [Merluccius polli]|uniref:Complement C3 n=1 Tax=Merluccius polli TaxID=89951 RepID=A0AA47MW49_MERPO|nr:Complement C3 [Merluccius polli]
MKYVMLFPLQKQMSLPYFSKTTYYKNKTVLQDTITTWHLTGISLSPTHGICVDDTLQMIVQQDFFIDLRLPYSAVRGEQIEIKAILHNYLFDEITVQVQLKETEHVCSSASNKGGYTQTVTVGPESTRSVPFIIVPMEHGPKYIEIKAAAGDRRDAIRKILKVVPRGKLLTKKVSIGLSPAKYKGKQVETIQNLIDVKDIVPNTPKSTRIYVSGGVQMLVEKVLDGSYMSSLIRQPSGCGEQNLAKMTLPIIAATYLDKTNQWDRVGTSLRDAALAHIKKGYQTQLAYRKDDGSFYIYKRYSSSSWLTAYAAKVFAMAYNLVDIDKNVLCGAIRWVILNSQMPNGRFVKIGRVYDGRIMGGMRAMDIETLTAFSLISMQEALSICGESVTTMTESINKAVRFLEGRLSTVKNTYAVAMVSYALAVANKNKFNKTILYKFASQGFSDSCPKRYRNILVAINSTHWPVANHHLFTLEATSYALLALVKVKEFEDAAQIVKWLNTQMSVGGGYDSTQSTTMVYQALAEYWVMASNVQNEMEIEIQVPGRSEVPSYVFNKQNAFQTRTTRNSINMDVNITAKGTGEATVSVVSLYYARPTAHTKLNNCERFELNVSMYRDMDKDAGMTILDIGLLTGYTSDVADLDKLSNNVDRTISKYEMNKVLSDRGSLIIYLDKVSHKQREEVAFKIRQQMRVGVLEPAAVSIYEYYDRSVPSPPEVLL